MKRLLLPLLAGSLGVLLLPIGARAHGLESSLQRLGNLTAGLETHYSNGLPAGDANVRLLVPGASCRCPRPRCLCSRSGRSFTRTGQIRRGGSCRYPRRRL